jgi:hypothetical protein
MQQLVLVCMSLCHCAHVCEQGETANITDTYSTKNVLPTPDTALGGHNDVAIVSQNSTTVDGARVSFTI